MLRSIFNAIAEKFNCTVPSRRTLSTTSILLERDPAGNESKKESSPEWAKTTVVPQGTVPDEPSREKGVVQEKVEMKVDTLEETREKLKQEESSSIGRSRENSLNSSRAFHEADQKFGERIADDALVTFCDRLKAAVEKRDERKFEGWLPINNVLIFARMVTAKQELEKAKKKGDKKAIKALESELGGSEETQKEIEKAITGQHRVVQILYDPNRLHYVVIYRTPSWDSLYLFDSLLDVDHPKKSLKSISDQIRALFSHLYEDKIPIRIPISYEQQSDDWSCGYRAIACVLNVVLGRRVLNESYDLERIHTLLIDCLDSVEVSYKTFESRIISKSIPIDKDDDNEDDADDRIYHVNLPSGSRDKYDSDENNNEEKEET